MARPAGDVSGLTPAGCLTGYSCSAAGKATCPPQGRAGTGLSSRLCSAPFSCCSGCQPVGKAGAGGRRVLRHLATARAFACKLARRVRMHASARGPSALIAGDNSLRSCAARSKLNVRGGGWGMSASRQCPPVASGLQCAAAGLVPIGPAALGGFPRSGYPAIHGSPCHVSRAHSRTSRSPLGLPSAIDPLSPNPMLFRAETLGINTHTCVL